MEPGSKLYSNDLSFPLVYDVNNEVFVTTVMGGEQYSPSINGEKDLLFPFVRRFKFSLWSTSILIYKSQTSLIYLTLAGIIIRKIKPGKDEITIITKVLSPIKISLPIVVSEPYTNLIDLKRFKFDGFVYTPSGKFLRYFERGRSQNFTIRFD